MTSSSSSPPPRWSVSFVAMLLFFFLVSVGYAIADPDDMPSNWMTDAMQCDDCDNYMTVNNTNCNKSVDVCSGFNSAGSSVVMTKCNKSDDLDTAAKNKTLDECESDQVKGKDKDKPEDDDCACYHIDWAGLANDTNCTEDQTWKMRFILNGTDFDEMNDDSEVKKVKKNCTLFQVFNQQNWTACKQSINNTAGMPSQNQTKSLKNITGDSLCDDSALFQVFNQSYTLLVKLDKLLRALNAVGINCTQSQILARLNQTSFIQKHVKKVKKVLHKPFWACIFNKQEMACKTVAAIREFFKRLRLPAICEIDDRGKIKVTYDTEPAEPGPQCGPSKGPFCPRPQPVNQTCPSTQSPTVSSPEVEPDSDECFFIPTNSSSSSNTTNTTTTTPAPTTLATTLAPGRRRRSALQPSCTCTVLELGDIWDIIEGVLDSLFCKFPIYNYIVVQVFPNVACSYPDNTTGLTTCIESQKKSGFSTYYNDKTTVASCRVGQSSGNAGGCRNLCPCPNKTSDPCPDFASPNSTNTKFTLVSLPSGR